MGNKHYVCYVSMYSVLFPAIFLYIEEVHSFACCCTNMLYFDILLEKLKSISRILKKEIIIDLMFLVASTSKAVLHQNQAPEPPQHVFF
jgi:hypothetical protein